MWVKVLASAAIILLLCGIHPIYSNASGSPQLSIVFPLLSPRLSSQFGSRKHPVYKSIRHHNGVDLAAPMNSHVRAVSAGRVIFAGSYAGFGKLVTIEHDGGAYHSLYGHLNDVLVNTGERVESGDMVGRVGQTGTATGPHLHFEWRHKGKPIDPLSVFPSMLQPGQG